MSIFSPEWIGAVGTVMLAILAVFQDRIRGWIARPRLKLHAGASPPYCHKTSWTYPYPPNSSLYRSETEVRYFPCYYFRVGILNRGNAAAREVEVNAVSLKRKRADGKFELVSRFTPMNLLWAHEHTVYLHRLSPKLSKFCDVGHVIAPQDRQMLGHDLPGVLPGRCVLAFDLQVEPNMKGHLAEPGTYQLGLLIAGENCEPRECTIELVFSGDWYDSEEEMFAKGCGIRVV